MNNRLDENGWPICPVCDRSIRPGRTAALASDAIVHLHCWSGPGDWPVGTPPPAVTALPAEPA